MAEVAHGRLAGGAVKTLPQQPNDNPFFAPALAGVGIRWTASDASRETGSRALSATTSTVPRHPMNIFYNAGTYQDEVDEYNWIYNSTADQGSGICTANPATSASFIFESPSTASAIRNALRSPPRNRTRRRRP